MTLIGVSAFFVCTFTLAYALPNQIPKPHLADSQKIQGGQYNFLFFFGNSYTNIGFNPNGEQPSPSNPIGNPGYPGNDLTKGQNWADYLTVKFNNTPTLTYDFAYDCATVDAKIVAPCSNQVKTIVDQVDEFQQTLTTGSEFGDFTERNSLFLVWIGINDAHRSWNQNNVSNIMEAVVDRYMSKLDDLYNFGARNFVLLTVPPYDRTPQVNNTGQQKVLERNTLETLNSCLSRKYAELKDSHPEMRSLLIDMHPIFNSALDDPSKIGATNSSCIGAEETGCVWEDDFHPGTKMHQWIAENVAAQAHDPLGFFS